MTEWVFPLAVRGWDTDRHVTRDTAEAMDDLVAAMTKSLRIAEQARADSERVERFSRRMSVASLWVSIGSLAAAVGSIVVAIVALS